MSVKCGRCPAQIIWLKTPNGKSMPLDAEPRPEGNVVIRDGLAVVLKLAEFATAEKRRFVAHWSTCRNPPERKRKSS